MAIRLIFLAVALLVIVLSQGGHVDAVRATPVYYLITRSMNFRQAADQCKRSGGRLAQVRSSGENSAIIALLKRNGISARRTYWIGLNDKAREGRWVYDGGRASTFSFWANREPNNSGNEDCVTINHNSLRQWNDLGCGRSAKGAVCEKRRIPIYFLVTRSMNFKAAESQCIRSGGRIAQVRNSGENSAVIRLLELHKIRTGRTYWIGLNDKAREGRWVYGNRKSTYGFWANREPNNSGNEDCVTINKNSLRQWNDLGCGRSASGVLCEKRRIPNYYLITQSMNFNTAVSKCKNSGGRIAQVRNSLENSAVVALLERNQISARRTYWIGLNDKKREGTWRYEGDRVSTYGFWADREPNNSGNEDCVTINHNNRRQWNDLACRRSAKGVVCEKVEDTAYFLINRRMNVNQAKDECKRKGGRLAQPQSSEENSAIVSLLKRNGISGGNAYWIGVNDISKEGRWVLNNGAPIQYSFWAPREPNNSGNEDCATINNNKKYQWNDLGCQGSAKGAVCET